jgi:hypothetical protein
MQDLIGNFTVAPPNPASAIENEATLIRKHQARPVSPMWEMVKTECISGRLLVCRQGKRNHGRRKGKVQTMTDLVDG